MAVRPPPCYQAMTTLQHDGAKVARPTTVSEDIS